MTFKLIFFKNVLCQDLFIIFLVFTIQGTREETLGAVWTMFAVRNLNPMSKRTVIVYCLKNVIFCPKTSFFTHFLRRQLFETNFFRFLVFFYIDFARFHQIPSQILTKESFSSIFFLATTTHLDSPTSKIARRS